MSELVRGYVEAWALQAPAVSPQVPWEADRLAVPIAQEILVCFAGAAGVGLAEGLAGPLLPLALLSSTTRALPAGWEDRLRDRLGNVLGEWAHTMNRRELLLLPGWAAAVVAAAPVLGLDSDEQERLSRVIAAPGRVDDQSIDHIESVHQHCKRQEDSFGPYAVLQTVLAQRELVGSLLGGCSDVLRPRLLSVYGSMSTSVGIYFHDLDDPASAMCYCGQAREAAQEARNPELAIYALCMMSLFASQQGKAHAGVDFAAAAQGLVGKTDDVLLRACIAERFASAYGLDGQYGECMAAFDRALAGLALPAGRRSPESPVYWFNEGSIASSQSDCLLRRGKPVEAAARAQQALELCDTSVVGDFAVCTLHLGTARVLSGDIEEAARVVGEGAVLAARIRSVRLVKEVRAARGRMEPWRETPAVRQLDERLASVGFGGVRM
ncbi:MAG: hypothetical protein ACRDRP_09440 [Pseudonocardiaceae bacterium]